MDKLLSACALHSELILHLFKHYLVSPLARVSEICVMKSRVRIYFACVCLCVKFYLRYLLPPHFLREIFASLFYLLTLYNICFYFLFLALCYDLLFVLTKPNWTFSSLLFCFCLHQVRRLLLLSCFPFLSAACHVHRWRHLIESESVCECVLVSSRAYFDARRGCLRVWVSEVA